MCCILCSFGYPHYLHTTLFQVWDDVICQYWPRKQNVAILNYMSAQPCLSAMLAKAHAFLTLSGMMCDHYNNSH